MSKDDLIPNAAAQNGWNCFDIAAGIDRQYIVDEALTDDARQTYFRTLLAPEIMNAAVLTVVHQLSQEHSAEELEEETKKKEAKWRKQMMNLFGFIKGMPEKEATNIINEHCDFIDNQRKIKLKKKPVNWPRFALPRTMCVRKGKFDQQLKKIVVAFLNADSKRTSIEAKIDHLISNQGTEQALRRTKQERTQINSEFNQAKKSLRDFCHSSTTYTLYINKYYKQEGWFAFQPSIAGTGMVDIVAAIMQINFHIFQGDDFTSPYRKTLEKTDAVRKIYYNGFNHFTAYRPGWRDERYDETIIEHIIAKDTHGLLAFLRSKQNMAIKDPEHKGTALHWAAYHGDIDILEELYIAGVPLEEKDGSKARTALGYAAKRYSETSGDDRHRLATCIEFLWKQCGAKKETKDKDGYSPYYYCSDLFNADDAYRKKEQGVYTDSLPVRERSQSPLIVNKDHTPPKSINLSVTLQSGSQYTLPGYDIHTELRDVEHAFRRSCQQYKERLMFEKLIEALTESKGKHDPVRYIKSILENIFNRNLIKSLKESLLNFQEKVRIGVLSNIEKAEDKEKMTAYLTTEGGKVQKRLTPENLNNASALINKLDIDLRTIVDQCIQEMESQTPKSIKRQLSSTEKKHKHNKSDEDIEADIATIKKKRSARDIMPALPSGDDSTNFVCASLSFIIKKQNQQCETITLPIALKQSIFSINITRKDLFISEKLNAENNLYLQDLIFNRTIKKTNPSLTTATAESCSHSEQAVFYYLYDGDTQYLFVKRLLSKTPDIESIEAICLDMHSTRMMCRNCQQGGRSFLADTMGFRKHLIEILAKRSKLPESHPMRLPLFKQENPTQTKLFCRVTADIPHHDCNDPNLMSTLNEEPTTLTDPSDPFILDTRKLPVNNRDGASKTHKYSIAISGGSKVPNEYRLAYLQLVRPTLERAALLITQFLGRRHFKKQLHRKTLSRAAFSVALRLFGRQIQRQQAQVTPASSPRIKRSTTQLNHH